jgi:hypothetical protein
MENRNQTIQNITIYWENEDAFYEKAINDFLSPSEKSQIIRDVVSEKEIEFRGDPFESKKDDLEIRKRLKFLSLKKIDRIISENREKLYQIICVQFEYCEKKKSGKLNSDGLSLSINIVDGILMFFSGIPIPLSSLIYYLVKNNLLEKLCRC